MEVKPGGYRCVECGHVVEKLYHKFPNKLIKIFDCDSCGSVADKYIEYDHIITVIDTLLLTCQAYRHLLFNSDIVFTRRIFILLFCDAYSKWVILPKTGETPDIWRLALEWQCYFLFLLSAAEFACLFGFICLMLRLFSSSPTSPRAVFNALVLAHAGKLIGALAVIWGRDDVVFFLLAAHVLVLASTAQAVRVVSGCSLLAGAMLGCAGHVLKNTASDVIIYFTFSATPLWWATMGLIIED